MMTVRGSYRQIFVLTIQDGNIHQREVQLIDRA